MNPLLNLAKKEVVVRPTEAYSSFTVSYIDWLTRHKPPTHHRASGVFLANGLMWDGHPDTSPHQYAKETRNG